MNRLILITGDLASGKSTLATSLSYALNIPCFIKDTIKEKYADMYGFTTREENRALSVKAVNHMISAYEQFAKNGSDVILEANFRSEELNRLKELSEKYTYEVVLFILRSDIEVLYQRFLVRLPDRHKAHTSMHLDDNIDKFASYVNELRKEDPVFIPHIIDTTKLSEKEVLDKALNILRK